MVPGDDNMPLVSRHGPEYPPGGALVNFPLLVFDEADQPMNAKHPPFLTGRGITSGQSRKPKVFPLSRFHLRRNHGAAAHQLPFAADSLFENRVFLLEPVIVVLLRPILGPGTLQAVFAKFNADFLVLF